MSSTPLDLLKESPKDRFEVAVAVLAIVTTLIAALLGVAFARASNEGDAASFDAQRLSLDAAGASSRATQATGRVLRLLELQRERAARARAAFEFRMVGNAAPVPGLGGEGARWRRLADETDALVEQTARASAAIGDIGPRGAYGLEKDPAFPSRFLNRSQREEWRLLALRDGANEEAVEWGKRTASYAAILTILAVALYLFGFALTPQGTDLRGLFASVGVVFLGLGIVFGPVRALYAPSRAPDRAAEAYAEGRVALADADFVRAKRLLSRAIAARPSFADAYRFRAHASFYAGTPQAVQLASLTGPKALRQSIEDLRMARALGLRTPETLGDLGFDLLALGLQQDRSDLVNEAVEVTQEALDDLPRNLTLRYNEAVALLASGRVSQARAAYAAATRLMLREPDQSTVSAQLSGALTDLQLVADDGPAELIDETLALKELIVGSVARGKLGEARSRAEAPRVSVFVEPGVVEFGITDPLGVSDGDGLVAEWWQQVGRFGWSQLGPISEYKAVERVGERLVASQQYSLAAGRCLQAGRYRVDLYDNGRLIGEGESDYRGPRFKYFEDHDRAIGGCRPASWDPVASGSPLVGGFQSDDGRSGLLLLRLNGRRDSSRSGSARVARAVLDQVFPMVREHFAGIPRYTPDASLESQTFVASGTGRLRYLYPGGEIHAGVASDTDRSLIVAVVYGPRREFHRDDSELVQIFGSLGTLFETAAPGGEGSR